MRLFLAINLPADVRQAIAAATASVRDVAPELSWVDETRIHLTLKFLDDQPEDRTAAIRAAAEQVGARHRQFMMHVGGLGAFPNFRRSRVVWIGVEQESRLELLHHDVETAFLDLGFDVEGRPFRPHITLARVKHPLPEERARMLSRMARRVGYSADLLVRSLDLMCSALGPGGSAYSILATAPLRSE